MEFQDAYESFKDDIRIAALSQRVPGLDYDDIQSEMRVCLWKAVETWDQAKGPLGTYWWSLWLNRRSDLTDAHNRLKRPKQVLTSEVRGTSYVMCPWPQPPEKWEWTQKMVWHLLASGESVKDVIDMLDLTKRDYYNMIRSWRTEDIRAILSRF